MIYEACAVAYSTLAKMIYHCRVCGDLADIIFFL